MTTNVFEAVQKTRSMELCKRNAKHSIDKFSSLSYEVPSKYKWHFTEISETCDAYGDLSQCLGLKRAFSLLRSYLKDLSHSILSYYGHVKKAF